MIIFIELLIGNFGSFELIILLIGLIVILFLGYLILFRFDRKISFLYPGKRNHLEITAIDKTRSEFFKQHKQNELYQMVINLTIESRNLIRRLSEEIRNLEELYNESQQIRSLDLEILNDLNSKMNSLPVNLEKLMATNDKYINEEIQLLVYNIKHTLIDCNVTTDHLLNTNPGEIEKKSFATYTKNIESKYLDIKELHDQLIKNFQEKFSKSIS
jgi:hypothetical protein